MAEQSGLAVIATVPDAIGEATATGTSADGETVPSRTATAESARNPSESSVTELTHDEEAQEKSKAAVEQKQLAEDTELTQSSEQPCPSTTSPETCDVSEKAGSEKEQTAGDQSSSEEPSTGAVLSVDQVLGPTSTEAGEDAGQTSEKSQDTAVSEPGQETPASPAETQEQTQSENTGTESQPTSESDKPAATMSKPVEKSTEATNEIKPVQEPQQSDQSGQASAANATSAEVGLAELISANVCQIQVSQKLRGF